MIKIRKAKTARGKRALKKQEPKLIENTKSAMFLKGTKSSQIVNDALVDLCALKKPNAISLTKKNDIHPFEDHSQLDFLCSKNDCSLFMFGSHSKKRPHTITLGRSYNGHVMEMIELQISNYHSIASFGVSGCGYGQKPLIVCAGELFGTSTVHQQLQSMLLDFYRGDTVTNIALNGIEHVISVTAKDDTLHFRVYLVQLKKSGSKTPRVELKEMGPFFDAKIGRVMAADDETMKQAMKQPKAVLPKKVKNISKDALGDKYGRIHVGDQKIDDIQTRKMKGLKRSRDEADGEAKKQKVEEDE